MDIQAHYAAQNTYAAKLANKTADTGDKMQPRQAENSAAPDTIKLQDGREGRIIPMQKMIESSPVEKFDLGNGMYIEKQGPMFKLKGEGAENVSIRDTLSLYQMRHMGTSAGGMVDAINSGKATQEINENPDENGVPDRLTGTKNNDSFVAGRDISSVEGDGGNDYISIKNGTASGGEGEDYLTGRGVFDGGAGRDAIIAAAGSKIDGGAGDDFLSINGRGTINGGDGNDRIEAGSHAKISGGAGNDYIVAGRDNTISYNRGDGQDVITTRHGENDYVIRHAPFLKDVAKSWSDAGTVLNSTNIAFGDGIAASDLSFIREENRLQVKITGSKDDMLTVDKVDVNGIPNMVMADGSMITGQEIQNMLGYAPVDLTA